MRSNENFTSSAVISPKPSVNIWPGFRRNSMTVGDTCLTSAAASSSSSEEFGFCFIRRWKTTRMTLPSQGPVRLAGSSTARSRSMRTVMLVRGPVCAGASSA